MEKGMVKMT